jgi:hypothetical protein
MTVGANQIPYPVGAQGSAISDRAANAFLSYFGHWLRESLNAKLADLGGQTTAKENYASAVPVGNQFPYDHENVWPQNNLPALYLWWNGGSKTIPKTLVYSLRERVLNFTWIFCELRSPKTFARAGLSAMIDAIFRQAHYDGTHPTWVYTDSERTYAAGTSVGKIAGVVDWQINEINTGKFAPVAEFQPEGREQSFYPACVGMLTIWERIGASSSSLDRQADANAETRIQIDTSENGGFIEEPVTVAEVIVLVP